MPRRVERTSLVDAPPAVVWERITSPKGINDELRPILKMTVPRAMRGRGGGHVSGDVEPGTSLGRSWILLFGLLPIDYDDIGIVEWEPGHRFLERSEMLNLRRWEHERVLTPKGSATEVTDRLGFELRFPLAYLPGADRLVAALVGALFSHRHRRLRAYFT